MGIAEPEDIGEDDVKALELPKDVKERLEELRALSKKAEAGEKGARQELKQALRESSPAVIARASDIGRKAQHVLIDTAAGGEPLAEYALSARLDTMRAEVAGENPTPLDVLLTERVVACWMLVELFDVLMAAQLAKSPDPKCRVPFSTLKHYLRWQEVANTRYLAAIKALAQVRRLQSGIPNSQTNVQVNIGSQKAELPKELPRPPVAGRKPYEMDDEDLGE